MADVTVVPRRRAGTLERPAGSLRSAARVDLVDRLVGVPHLGNGGVESHCRPRVGQPPYDRPAARAGPW
jgi:hypothetical protein